MLNKQKIVHRWQHITSTQASFFSLSLFFFKQEEPYPSSHSNLGIKVYIFWYKTGIDWISQFI